jgi:hypothetical protein
MLWTLLALGINEFSGLSSTERIRPVSVAWQQESEGECVTGSGKRPAAANYLVRTSESIEQSG